MFQMVHSRDSSTKLVWTMAEMKASSTMKAHQMVLLRADSTKLVWTMAELKASSTMKV